jgi:hypothetical protein
MWSIRRASSRSVAVSGSFVQFVSFGSFVIFRDFVASLQNRPVDVTSEKVGGLSLQ